MLYLLLVSFSIGIAHGQLFSQELRLGPNAYVAECVPEDTTTERLWTEDESVEFVRTPESAFDGIADAGFPWEPKYVTVDGGLRMHYIEEGPADADEVVLLLHGQPTWSFLYRKMIPVFIERGYRVISVDHIGMGRSDKPTSLLYHTYQKHVDNLKEFIAQVIPQALDEPTINAFVQDWGSLIGLRVVGDEASWFRRVVVANGLLPVFPLFINPLQAPNPVNYDCEDSRTILDMAIERFTSRPCGLDTSCFGIWLDYAITNPIWNASGIVEIFNNTVKDETVFYDAPFPTSLYRSAIRAFPSMIAGFREPWFGNRRAWNRLLEFERPFLVLAGERDLNLGSVENQNNFIDNVPGATNHDFEHKRYAQAGHFIQEDSGEEVAEYVSDFIDGTPVDLEGWCDCGQFNIVCRIREGCLFP